MLCEDTLEKQPLKKKEEDDDEWKYKGVVVAYVVIAFVHCYLFASRARIMFVEGCQVADSTLVPLVLTCSTVSALAWIFTDPLFLVLYCLLCLTGS